MKPRMSFELRSGGLSVLPPEVSAQQLPEVENLDTLPAAEIKSRVEAAGGIYTNKSTGIEFLRGQNNAG